VRRYRSTTDSDHEQPIAPNLLARNFQPPVQTRAGRTTRPNSSPAAATCTWPQCSTCTPASSSAGLLFHSDRGIEFAAKSFRAQLAHAGAVQSMSRRGNCWDNAVAESFFSTLEFEMDPSAAWRWMIDRPTSCGTSCQTTTREGAQARSRYGCARRPAAAAAARRGLALDHLDAHASPAGGRGREVRRVDGRRIIGPITPESAPFGPRACALKTPPGRCSPLAGP
jgi:transposase InsO family protein